MTNKDSEENILLKDSECGQVMKLDITKAGIIKCKCGRKIGKVDEKGNITLIYSVNIQAKKVKGLSIVGSLD